MSVAFLFGYVTLLGFLQKTLRQRKADSLCCQDRQSTLCMRNAVRIADQHFVCEVVVFLHLEEFV